MFSLLSRLPRAGVGEGDKVREIRIPIEAKDSPYNVEAAREAFENKFFEALQLFSS